MGGGLWGARAGRAAAGHPGTERSSAAKECIGAGGAGDCVTLAGHGGILPQQRLVINIQCVHCSRAPIVYANARAVLQVLVPGHTSNGMHILMIDLSLLRAGCLLVWMKLCMHI